MTARQVDHDGLFKQLLDTFLVEFMEVFFPHASEWIDFDHLKPLPTETISDLPTGARQVVDLVLETRLKESDTLLLIHIEPQAYVQADFNERMYIYASHLFNNPAAAALLSKMRFRPHERVQVKLEFLRMLTRMQLDPARTELLGGFFESYLRLNTQEEAKLNEALKTMSAKGETTMQQLTTSWHKKGRAEGRAEGQVEATKSAIIEYLEARFDTPRTETSGRLDQITDAERLKALRGTVFRSTSQEEAFAKIEAAAPL